MLDFNQSSKAAFILVCQPAPVALNATRVCVDSRIVMGCFGSILNVPMGRPRRFTGWLS